MSQTPILPILMMTVMQNLRDLLASLLLNRLLSVQSLSKGTHKRVEYFQVKVVSCLAARKLQAVQVQATTQ